jgi:hypothetical protein
MRFIRPLVLAAVALAATAPPAHAATLKIKGGTTTLTFGAPAIESLTGMGIAIAPTQPATAAGPALAFPIKSGSLKVSGRQVRSGRVMHTGGMTLSTDTLTIALTKPVVSLAGRRSALDATTSFGGGATLATQMATLDLSRAKTSLTAKRLKLTGVKVKLTKLAAEAMNGGFAVTGFTPGFEIGTATLQADLKR